MQAVANTTAVGMFAGGYHSMALTAEGALFSFGRGPEGKLGHGDTADQLAQANEKVVGMATWYMHSLALTEGVRCSAAYGGCWRTRGWSP